MKVVCALFLMAVLCWAASEGGLEEELAIRKVLADSTGALNRHVENLTPDGYSDDFDAVNPAGVRVAGKPNLGEAFKTNLRNAHKIENVQRIRLIRPDVALVDTECEFTGTDMKPHLKLLEAIVLVKENGHWTITALRMTIPASPVGAPMQ